MIICTSLDIIYSLKSIKKIKNRLYTINTVQTYNNLLKLSITINKKTKKKLNIYWRKFCQYGTALKNQPKNEK